MGAADGEIRLQGELELAGKNYPPSVIGWTSSIESVAHRNIWSLLTPQGLLVFKYPQLIPSGSLPTASTSNTSFRGTMAMNDCVIVFAVYDNLHVVSITQDATIVENNSPRMIPYTIQCLSILPSIDAVMAGLAHGGLLLYSLKEPTTESGSSSSLTPLMLENSPMAILRSNDQYTIAVSIDGKVWIATHQEWKDNAVSDYNFIVPKGRITDISFSRDSNKILLVSREGIIYSVEKSSSWSLKECIVEELDGAAGSSNNGAASKESPSFIKWTNNYMSYIVTGRKCTNVVEWIDFRTGSVLQKWSVPILTSSVWITGFTVVVNTLERMELLIHDSEQRVFNLCWVNFLHRLMSTEDTAIDLSKLEKALKQ